MSTPTTGLPDPSDLPVWTGTRDELLAAVMAYPVADIADALGTVGGTELDLIKIMAALQPGIEVAA